MGCVRLNLSIACVIAFLALCLAPAAGAVPGALATVSLTTPSNGAILTADKPTFAGTASTGPVVKNAVTINVYLGASATGTPIETLGGAPSSTGAWLVASPFPLGDGQYTARAEQDDVLGGRAFSNAVTFIVKVHPPALTISHPGQGTSISRFAVFFAGQAGTAIGDSPDVSVSLFRGAQTTSSAIWSQQLRADGSSWFAAFDQTLPVGTYIVEATQTDIAGHTARVDATFQVVSGPKQTIGGFVTLNRSGAAAIPISCLAPMNTTCKGTLLIVTIRRYRATAGGPFGQLKVMYVYVQIPGGSTELIHARIPGPAARVLRRARGGPVRVTAVLGRSGGRAAVVSARRTLFLR